MAIIPFLAISHYQIILNSPHKLNTLEFNSIIKRFIVGSRPIFFSSSKSRFPDLEGESIPRKKKERRKKEEKRKKVHSFRLIPPVRGAAFIVQRTPASLFQPHPHPVFRRENQRGTSSRSIILPNSGGPIKTNSQKSDRDGTWR